MTQIVVTREDLEKYTETLSGSKLDEIINGIIYSLPEYLAEEVKLKCFNLSELRGEDGMTVLRLEVPEASPELQLALDELRLEILCYDREMYEV
jgi:hypothetical protein